MDALAFDLRRAYGRGGGVLGRFGAGLAVGAAGDAVVAFGLLFIPSPNEIRVEGDVSGMPGLHYAWDRDESLLHLTYNDADGRQRTFTAALDDEVFRDSTERIVGRILPNGGVAIDTAAVSANLAQEDEPKLCPAPGPDKAGGSERGRDYEDYVKTFINPENPTPRGWGFSFRTQTITASWSILTTASTGQGRCSKLRVSMSECFPFRRAHDQFRIIFLINRRLRLQRLVTARWSGSSPKLPRRSLPENCSRPPAKAEAK